MASQKSWVEITVSLAKAHVDTVASTLIRQGSNGVIENKIVGKKNAVLLTAYIKHGRRLSSILRQLEICLAGLPQCHEAAAPPPHMSVRTIPDEDWNKKWKSFFQPLRATDRIVIKPSWTEYWKQPHDIVIEIDPGMAFGTGTHPSTRMCLKAIESLWPQTCNRDTCSLLDVGTGSGILAIAAALIGFPEVVGIDYDYQAVACARNNAARNNLPHIVFSTTPLKKVEGAFSIVVANILPHVLINMREPLIAHCARRGFLILSGILTIRALEVREAFMDTFEVYKELTEDEWTCLVLKES